MSQTECTNCVSLTVKCLKLEDEVNKLNRKLDHLIASLSYDKKDFGCQSIPIFDSISTQTINCDSISSECSTQTDNALFVPADVTLETSNLSSNGQDDVLLDIFLKTNKTDNYAVPLVKLPFVLIPNHPFSQFDFDRLDKETVYDKRLHNRSVAYYGETNYSYTNITHVPKSLPECNTYLNQLLDHLRLVLPDFEYNSVLVTKYMNGSDHLGFHSDDEPQIVEHSDIVTISLGETRMLRFRSKSLGDNYPEQTLEAIHGAVFIMSRDSQNFFQHSVVADSSLSPRISLTLRLLKSSSSTPVAVPNQVLSAPTISSTGMEPVCQSSSNATNKKLTLYIGDSMLRHIKRDKMSSNTQEAEVFCYPGATVAGVLSKLKTDQTFININPRNVGKVFLFCGANNTDKILNIPFAQNSNFVESNLFTSSEEATEIHKSEITELISFIHTWAESTPINFINILPRVSSVRNQVINHLNNHIKHLSNICPYLSMVSTELDRNLFAFKSGFRKDDFFSSNGLDNVHLNSQGIVRLARHLKYVAHK